MMSRPVILLIGTAAFTALSLAIAASAIIQPAKPLTTPLFVLDQPNVAELPKHFRTSSDAPPAGINAAGLSDLHMAGSAAPSQLQATAALKRLPGAVIVVDLRQESHGYVNGNAVSWYGPLDDANAGKTDAEVRKTENALLATLREQHSITPNKIVTKNAAGQITAYEPVRPITVSSVLTEGQMWRRDFNISSYRVFLSDRQPPNVAQIDRFIAFSKGIKGAWLWFHCRAGDGRTTTLMALWDMMHNAKRVPLADIFARQHAIGGVDLTHVGLPSQVKYTWDKRRLTILQAFYAYARANNDQFTTAFSSWLAQSAEYRKLLIPLPMKGRSQ